MAPKKGTKAQKGTKPPRKAPGKPKGDETASDPRRAGKIGPRGGNR